MGWRASDNYDRANEAEWRARPWRHRYAWKRIALIFTYAALALFVGLWNVYAESIAPHGMRVIDGDTIAADQHDANIRLVGFNAPEIRNAKCEDEGRLGVEATNRLRELVRGGELDLAIVACACRPGTHGTRACNFGRACGVLKAGGVDVGETLVAEGLAVPFKCGATRCPKMPRPWCR